MIFNQRTPSSSAGQPTIRLAPPATERLAKVTFTDWDERVAGTPDTATVTYTFDPDTTDTDIAGWAGRVGQHGVVYRHQGRQIYIPPHCILSIAWEDRS